MYQNLYILFPSFSDDLTQVNVEYTSLAAAHVELRYPYGFELGCSNGVWLDATAITATSNRVTVGIPSCEAGSKPTLLRYCWRANPCTFKMCPVYSGDLPSSPFEISLTTMKP